MAKVGEFGVGDYTLAWCDTTAAGSASVTYKVMGYDYDTESYLRDNGRPLNRYETNQEWLDRRVNELRVKL